MAYASLRECVVDLERAKKLRAIDAELDGDLEVAAVHRRVYAAGGPALLFRNVRGSRFPLVSNVFGTKERAHFVLRHGLDAARALLAARMSPADLLARPLEAMGIPRALSHAVPRFVRRAPSMQIEARVSDLPRVRAWPRDGGAFITLPQVYTESPDAPGISKSNLGMYRIQLNGNAYVPDFEVGMHYQIHRGIGVHHAAALARNESLRANVFVGGPPAMTFAAMLPLPEGMPEVLFAGVLGGRATRWVKDTPNVHADADFVVRGEIGPGTKPEGPFGDHLGYYSETHPFPVLRIRSVTHREDALWPFTVVGRPPQEDTTFGEIVHDLFGETVTSVLPGVRAVRAVDEAGVHPLLLAIGSERYAPYRRIQKPMEILTQANAILGQGQLSLAKYLFIADGSSSGHLDVRELESFFRHVLERIDPSCDLHFQTHTTIDTLDYSGTALDEGSKLVVAVCGEARRTLQTAAPRVAFPPGFGGARIAMPGVLVVRAPRFERGSAERFCASFEQTAIAGFPLVVLVDDEEFTARTIANFVWVTFTRSDPARDVHGIGAFIEDKAWGCRGSIVIDARIKPGHAPALEEDPATTKRIESLTVRGGPLSGLWE
jgi:4-hydroxy-3-polyprenylbenzoate decarboxylase